MSDELIPITINHTANTIPCKAISAINKIVIAGVNPAARKNSTLVTCEISFLNSTLKSPLD